MGFYSEGRFMTNRKIKDSSVNIKYIKVSKTTSGQLLTKTLSPASVQSLFWTSEDKTVRTTNSETFVRLVRSGCTY